MELRIDGVEVRDTRVSFVDESVPRHLQIEALNFSTEGIAPGEPFTDTEVSGTLHLDGFAPEGLPFKAQVPKAMVAADMSAIDVAEFSVALGGLEAEGGVKGTLGEQPKLAGTLR